MLEYNKINKNTFTLQKEREKNVVVKDKYKSILFGMVENLQNLISEIENI